MLIDNRIFIESMAVKIKGTLSFANCKQVIFKKELSDHYNHHTLDNHFPSLGKVQQFLILFVSGGSKIDKV
ncbi:hypothetical protein NQ317_003650 [Molorchus minor]|uniref:Uncharacterized protein n=1 Tax=Molorchus minor TaxID=1323400 RepID=A0ABQ9JGR4_9CUCU|nr:hypothetical protein NQ317_003650 [Molorchus minor]